MASKSSIDASSRECDRRPIGRPPHQPTRHQPPHRLPRPPLADPAERGQLADRVAGRPSRSDSRPPPPGHHLMARQPASKVRRTARCAMGGPPRGHEIGHRDADEPARDAVDRRRPGHCARSPARLPPRLGRPVQGRNRCRRYRYRHLRPPLPPGRDREHARGREDRGGRRPTIPHGSRWAARPKRGQGRGGRTRARRSAMGGGRT